MPIVSGFTLLLMSAPVDVADRRPVVLPTSAIGTAFQAGTRFRPLIEFARADAPPRLLDKVQSHDPFQFAAVRALRFDRGRYRPSPIDAKLEFRTNGESSSVGVGGAVSRLLQRVAR